MNVEEVSITAFGQSGDAEAFARLNLEWLETLFAVEDDDRRILGDPATTILVPGGHILVARSAEKVIGVCALIPVDQTAYELAKMSVDQTMRGQGIGRKLLAATVARARELGAEMLLLNTNTKLANAIHLYREAGFVPSDDPRHHRYGRSDVFMELRL
jgi:putative acetyltransferase